MLATGWALCQTTALHEYQATDFLTDGYRLWRASPSFEQAEGVAFLRDLFGALRSVNPPPVPDDIWSAPPESVMPAGVYHATRCWAGNELLELLIDPAMRAEYEPLVYRSIVSAPVEFVPPRSREFARSYAASHGEPEPWAAAAPSPRAATDTGSDTRSGTPREAGSGEDDVPDDRRGTSGTPAPAATRDRPRDRPRPTPHPSPRPVPTATTNGAPPPPTAQPAIQSAPQPAVHSAAQSAGPQPSAPSTSEPAEPAAGGEQDPLETLRRRLLAWLQEEHDDVRMEDNGWITLPHVGPTAVQIETSRVAGDHLKVEVFAPLVLDVPVTPALLRHVALQSGRFHFGVVSLDAGEDGSDDTGLLQFSCSLLGDDLGADAFRTVVRLVSSTAEEEAEALRSTFGGSLYRELAAG
jgi:hypothetical protein